MYSVEGSFSFGPDHPAYEAQDSEYPSTCSFQFCVMSVHSLESRLHSPSARSSWRQLIEPVGLWDLYGTSTVSTLGWAPHCQRQL